MNQKTRFILTRFIMGFLFLGFAVMSAPQAFAGKYIMPPIAESKAYKIFENRPVSDLSKLLYLIDRFGTMDIQIRYDGHDYTAPFVARLTKWFLARNYHKETPQSWIMKWCNTSVGGQLIWARMPDGSYRLAREILMEELTNLEQAVIASAKAKTSQDSTLAVATLSPLAVAPPNTAQ